MEKIIQDFGHHRAALLALDLPAHDRRRARPRHAPDLRDPPGEDLARPGLSPCPATRPGAAPGRPRATEAGMLVFLLRRIGVMVLTALCLTLIVFSPRQPQAEPRQARQGADRQPDHRAAGRGLARPERLQPAVPRALRRVARRRRARRLRAFDAVQRAGRRRALAAALADRQADVLGDGGDGARGAAARGARRHARGLGAGPGALDRRDRHHLDARSTSRASC